MLLKLVPTLPEGDHWHYEVKWDGYRCVAVVERGKARLWSRNERDLGMRFPVLVDALASLPARSAVLDGEIVVLDEAGKPDFEALQYFQPASAARLYFYAFDLLHLDGEDLTRLPLTERRARLEVLLGSPPANVRLSSTLDGTPEALVPAVRAQGLEGIVAKDARSLYEPGKRSGKWQKFKLNLEEEFVIGGFIPSANGGIETLVLGLAEGAALRYVASLPLHMPLRASREVRARLEAIATTRQPFTEIPTRKAGGSWHTGSGMTPEELALTVWVKPRLKAEVSFLEWTKGGFLRHAKVKKVHLTTRPGTTAAPS
jgi:DNA ligase D-like protein (predicted ligase)